MVIGQELVWLNSNNILGIPSDLIKVIADYTSVYSNILRTTCNRLHKVINIRKISKDELCEQTALCGNLKLLKWINDNLKCVNQKCITIAAKKGHLEMLIWLYHNGCVWNQETCTVAALNNNSDILTTAFKTCYPKSNDKFFANSMYWLRYLWRKDKSEAIKFLEITPKQMNEIEKHMSTEQNSRKTGEIKFETEASYYWDTWVKPKECTEMKRKIKDGYEKTRSLFSLMPATLKTNEELPRET